MADRNIEVPIDYDPRVIEGDGPSAREARGAMTALHGAWVRIRDAAADESVDLPRLAKAATGAMERALTAADSAGDRIDRQVRALEQGIAGLTQPRVDPALATEIRGHWRERGWTNGMPEAVRADPRTASAILSAPSYLSGLDDKQRDVIRLAAVQAHAGPQRAALDEAIRSRDRLQRAAGRMMELVVPRIRDWQRPENSDLKALEALGRG